MWICTSMQKISWFHIYSGDTVNFIVHGTADLLTVLNWYLVTLDISKAFDRIWDAGLLHKLKSYGFLGHIFGLISSLLSIRWLRVVLDRKSLQEYPVNGGVSKSSIRGPTLFSLHINNLPDDVICNTAIYADDTTLYSKSCDQAPHLWQ